jgi:DNA-binding protein H-NS
MTNLIDIQGQIEKLQKQANDIRAKEFDRTVQEILMTMQAFGITIKDLNTANLRTAKSRSKGGVPAKKARAKSSPAAGLKVAPKFRGPQGETWSGRGLMPRWLSALVAQGREKDEFAVKD